jgi:hypothetical protein
MMSVRRALLVVLGGGARADGHRRGQGVSGPPCCAGVVPRLGPRGRARSGVCPRGAVARFGCPLAWCGLVCGLPSTRQGNGPPASGQ